MNALRDILITNPLLMLLKAVDQLCHNRLLGTAWINATTRAIQVTWDRFGDEWLQVTRLLEYERFRDRGMFRGRIFGGAKVVTEVWQRRQSRGECIWRICN